MANKKRTKRREKVEKQHADPDPSIHGEVDESPLSVLLADPRRLKDDPDASIMSEIESLPVLQLFSHHLKDFEGGSRKPAVAKDHTRRVSRLLYEVQYPAMKVHQLWDNKNLNILRNNLFRGNDKLGMDKRQPQTHEVYIISLHLFYRFIIARQEDVKMLDTVTDEDLRLINSALLRLDTWPKAFSDAANLRKADIRKRGLDERLTTKDIQSFFNSERAREIMEMYHTLAADEQATVDVKKFSTMRDYLLLRVIMASCQRCGAQSNDGVWTQTSK